jgi:hypothetical protein
VNNAVSRVAGLLAIAVFGVVLTHDFQSRLQPTLKRLAPPARAELTRELPKMAGAKVSDPKTAGDVHAAFAGSFGVIMLDTAGLALLAALAGLGTGGKKRGGASSRTHARHSSAA